MHTVRILQLITEGGRIQTEVHLTPRLLYVVTCHPKLLPSHYSLFWTQHFVAHWNPFQSSQDRRWQNYPRRRQGEHVKRCGCYKAYVGKFWPVSSSMILFIIVSKTWCVSSWMTSSLSSADVTHLKGGVNLITHGIMNVTNEASSFLDRLFEKTPSGAWVAWLSLR